MQQGSNDEAPEAPQRYLYRIIQLGTGGARRDRVLSHTTNLKSTATVVETKTN